VFELQAARLWSLKDSRVPAKQAKARSKRRTVRLAECTLPLAQDGQKRVINQEGTVAELAEIK
jgi:hypothetical protein